MNKDYSDKPLILLDILHKALLYYKQGFQFFISISLIYALLGEAGGILLSKLNVKPEELMLFKALVNIFIACWASVAIIFSAYRFSQGRKFDPVKALSVAQRKYGMYVCVYLTMLMIIGFGFVLFIVPGLYFMTIFLFADILVVCKNVSFRQAFAVSARLIRPFFWQVFVYLMLVVGVSLVPEMIYQLGMSLYPALASSLQKVSAVVIMPFLMIAQVELFFQIETRRRQGEQTLEDQIEYLSPDE